MKKLFLILFLVVGYFANGQILQEPNVYGYKFKRVGSDSLHFIPSDTLQVPTRYNGLSFIANKGGALYYWNGTKWASFSSTGPTYTAGNGLTLSGSQFKLGGTLVDATTTVDADNKDITISNIGLFQILGTGAAVKIAVADAVTEINGGTPSVLSTITVDDTITLSSLTKSILSIGNRVSINPYQNQLYIDSLNYTLSTTGKKIMLRDTATGLVQNIDPALLRVVDTSYTTIATFTAGGGFASDTTMCTDSTLFGSFFTGQFDYTVAYIQAVIKGNAGDSIVLKLVYNDTFNVDGTKVNGAGLSLNNRYTGNVFTISTNRTIAANTWVWLKPEAVIIGKKPKYISVTLVGYKTYVTP